MARRLKLISKGGYVRWVVEVRVLIQGTPTWTHSGFSGAESDEPPLYFLKNESPGSKLVAVYQHEVASHGFDCVRIVRRIVETTVHLVDGATTE